ncbi:leukocidin family pore-forming toxin [Paraburkholderia fungorum]|uniref:leukocidin family pore-forming toxin n=1 Tax=Paraburkholderia fungorum TaxID=134537 RepID=UPI0038BC24CE
MKEAKIIRLVGSLLLMCGLAISTAKAGSMDIKVSPVAAVFNKFDSLKLNGIYYIGESNLDDIKELSKIRGMIFDEGRRYFIDFSRLSASRKKEARQALEQALGVSFPDNWLFIGQYKNELIYTPLRSLDDPALEVAVNRSEKQAMPPRNKRNLTTAPIANQPTLPHVSFYVDVNRRISDKECTFPNSIFWKHGSRSFCKNANISLVYRVNLIRSLVFGSGGSSTPDAKLVRISLDDQSTGAGIQLNDRDLTWRRSTANYAVMDGWEAGHSTDAIAKDYTFTLKAIDGAAKNGQSTSILKTYPASNLNVKYENRDISGFEIGVTGGIEVNKDGPKAKLEPRFSYKQDRWLTYHTEDYRVVRSSPNEKQVSFVWERQQYPTADSLLNVKTSPIWDTFYPIDRTRISPIGYRGFTPNFDVIFKAPPDAKGVTTFSMQSSVLLWAIYDGVYKHYYLVGSHKSYQGQDGWQKYRRISEFSYFDVNWNHPVFTGGRPVNLQLGGQNNACIAFGQEGRVTVETCDLKSHAQSFIYDQYGRYVSARDTGKCLDGNDLRLFRSCDASLSQRWKWKGNSEMLENDYLKSSFLAYNASNNQVTLASSSSPNVSMRILTKHTDIFSR